MNGVLVLGSGGHGKVVADILLCQGVAVQGFLDDDPARWGADCLGLPILAGIDDYARLSPDGIILGIGANPIREQIVRRLGEAARHLWCNAIHPRATIAGSARLGQGVVVAAGAVINPGTVVGDHVIVNTAATVDHDCRIADFAHIAPGANLAGGVHVGHCALLGIGTVVIPARSIGAYTLIGAGSVVVRDIPDRAVARGVPARWQTSPSS